MGFHYRKSLSLGPFRVSASKSGVGWSVGGGGLRTRVTSRGRRYTSFNVPGTGLGYRKYGGQGCLGVGFGRGAVERNHMNSPSRTAQRNK